MVQMIYFFLSTLESSLFEKKLSFLIFFLSGEMENVRINFFSEVVFLSFEISNIEQVFTKKKLTIFTDIRKLL